MRNPAYPRRSARRTLLTSLAVVAALGLAGCSATAADTPTTASSGSATKTLKIGFSPFSLQVPALKGLADGLTAAAKSTGDTVVTADPKTDPSTQLQQLQQWVQLGQVDAIWVIPVAGPTIAPVLSQATAKGIVVVASGVPSDYGFTGPQAGITFTNVDNADYGSKLGSLTAECINTRLGGNGKVIFLQSPAGAQSTNAINDEFKKTLAKESPNTKIVNEQVAKDRLGSQQLISSALQGAPDANTVVGTDDESTLGGLDSFSQAGKDSSKTCIVGAGGGTEAQAAVKSGKIYADLAFDFQADLMQNLQQLHKLAADPSAKGTQLTTPIVVIKK
jgi:ABC-type sugar transport system substrate-binding protein